MSTQQAIFQRLKYYDIIAFYHGRKLSCMPKKVFMIPPNYSYFMSEHRLTFWLSNSVVLRATISKFQRQLCLPRTTETILGEAVSKDKKKISSLLKWETFSSNVIKDDFCESFGNWEDPRTFTRALQRTEAWIFSLIVESIWWQVSLPGPFEL